jgi:hypothetical protein
MEKAVLLIAHKCSILIEFLLHMTAANVLQSFTGMVQHVFRLALSISIC